MQVVAWVRRLGHIASGLMLGWRVLERPTTSATPVLRPARIPLASFLAALAVIGGMLLALGGSPASAATVPPASFSGGVYTQTCDSGSPPEPCPPGYQETHSMTVNESCTGALSGFVDPPEPSMWSGQVTGNSVSLRSTDNYGDVFQYNLQISANDQTYTGILTITNGSGSAGQSTGIWSISGQNQSGKVSSCHSATSPRISGASKQRKTLKLTLSAAATLKVVIENKGKKVKTLTFSGVAGSNSFKLNLKGLKKGSYSAVITARNAAGTSGKTKLNFKIKS